MQSMTYEFNKEQVTKNIFHFLGNKAKMNLPFRATKNVLLEFTQNVINNGTEIETK